MPPKPKKSSDDAPDALPQRSIDEQIVEALCNPDVAEALGKAIGPMIALSVKELVSSSVKELLEENKNLRGRLLKIEEVNDQLKSRVVSLEDRLEDLDRDRKATNIIIRGLPESSYSERTSADGNAENGSSRHSSVAATVIDMIGVELNIKLQPQDIVTAFRMRAGKSDKSRPVLVKFSSAHVHESIMVAKKKLRSSTNQIYINEHLTKRTGELFALARNQVKQNKIHSSWTFKGQVFIKQSPDASAKPILIKSKDDLPR